jgi:dihydrofolate reductase
LSLSIIAALDKNSLIGDNGMLPWDIPEDLAWFKQQTMGKTVVMGRKTWLSLGKALPGRRNVVLTNSSIFLAEGADIIHSLSDVLALAKHDDVFVIGGAELFKQTLPHADTLYLSLIDQSFKGDTYFPHYHQADWIITSQHVITTKQHITISFNIYNRKILVK